MTERDEVTERLNRLARMIARIFGTDMGVDANGDRLIFVDSDDEPVMNDGEEMVAATAEEIDDKTVFNDFAVRALRAAMMIKYQEIERARTP